MSPDPELVIEAAAEFGVEPGFIEKDWYAVQVLAAVAAHNNPSILSVFCGGTSLSKAYGLLKRFSEDLDFRATYKGSDPKTQNKTARRQFRNEILSLLEMHKAITTDKIEPTIGSNYFKCAFNYSSNVKQSAALRPRLKVEYSFSQPTLGYELKPV